MKVYKKIIQSQAYREITRHRTHCANWRENFCLECFGGGLNVFIGKLMVEGVLKAPEGEIGEPFLIYDWIKE